jgi:hypothetical protein
MKRCALAVLLTFTQGGTEMATKDLFDQYIAQAQQREAGRTGGPSGPGSSSAFGGSGQLTGPGQKDYLGKSIDVQLGGTSGFDVMAGPPAAPSSAGGGTSGFMGGGGPASASGPQGTPDIARFIQQILGKVGQGEQKGQGGTSGFDFANMAPFSISPDVLSGLSGGSAGSFDLANAVPFDARAGLLSQEGMVAPSGSTAGSLAGMAIGPLLSILSSMATQDASPEMRAAISGLIQAVSPALAPAAAGAVSGIAAGTGALSGAAGSLAAAGPGLIASAPMAAMMISTSINDMLTKQAMAGQLEDRFKNLQQNLPGHIAALQKAPALLQQLEGVTDPAQAAQIYRQVEAIQKDFDASGMEDFLQHGYTTLGRTGYGDVSAGGQQFRDIFASLTPYMQAMDMARIRATDIAARGGQPIPGARPIYDYGFNLGSPAFMEAARPGSTTPGRGPVNQLLGTLYGAGEGGFAAPYTPGERVSVTPELATFLGLDPSLVGGTIGDLTNFIYPGSNRWEQFEPGSAAAKYMPSNYGVVNREIFGALQGIQPGNYEQGLAEIYGKYGGAHPGLSQWGFGTGGMAADQARTQLVQRALDASGGSSFPGGAFGPTGALSEEDRRRLGVR